MSLKTFSIAVACGAGCLALPAVAVPVVGEATTPPAVHAPNGAASNGPASFDSVLKGVPRDTFGLRATTVERDPLDAGIDDPSNPTASGSTASGHDAPVVLRLPQDFGYTISADEDAFADRGAPARDGKPTRTVSRVPEPLTWLMMVLGFGAIGGLIRARVRRSNAAFEAKLKRIAAGEIA